MARLPTKIVSKNDGKQKSTVLPAENMIIDSGRPFCEFVTHDKSLKLAHQVERLKEALKEIRSSLAKGKD